jgi:hypothetical protein
VALLFFRRPHTTAQVFARIRAAQPRVLLLAADGPRLDRPDEVAACEETRRIVEAAIDWDCTVHRHYNTSNKGLFVAVAESLNWIFSTVEEAIVLEDDCVPDPTFFHFCDVLLDKYRDDARVMHISGNAFVPQDSTASYSFSRYTLNWGWASWRRAWQHFDAKLSAWPSPAASTALKDVLPNVFERVFWRWVLNSGRQRFLSGHGVDWDAAWLFSCWLRGGLSIVSNVNLVSNIGHGEGGSHGFTADDFLMNRPTQPMSFPLTHPEKVVRNAALDAQLQRDVYVRLFRERIVRRMKSMFRRT